MSPTDIGFIGIAVLLILIFLGVHIGFALIIIGFAGFAFISGFAPAFANMGIVSFATTNNYNFTLIPLFLLMSAFVAYGGIGEEAYIAARAWVGQIRGGLAMATVAACALFAATSGSSLATALAMGKSAYPEMKKLNYASTLAAGCIAAGGTLGILIPPSMGFVLIGILTEISIGKLFMAGILPGVTQTLFYMVTIYIICKGKMQLGPSVPGTTFRQKIGSLRKIWSIAILFGLVVGGIYGGVFTPTETGGIGAFAALVIGLSRRQLSRSNIVSSLTETARTTAMIILLVIGAFIFMRFLSVSRIPFVLSQFIAGLSLSRYIILTIILLVYIILGMFFDIFAILTITVPITFPIFMALGFDPIWYGVLMVRVAEIGFISPPFGINLFGLVGAIDVPLSTLYSGVIPFIIADIFHLALLVAFPAISTFIPSLMSQK